MVIRIHILTGSADTAEQGTVLFNKMSAGIQEHGHVTVSFDQIDIATSSFVTASFVALLRRMSYLDLTSKVKVVKATGQIADMIKTRVKKAAAVAA